MSTAYALSYPLWAHHFSIHSVSVISTYRSKHGSVIVNVNQGNSYGLLTRERRVSKVLSFYGKLLKDEGKSWRAGQNVRRNLI